MLLFGKDRTRYFPDTWVQVGRFRGTDKSRIDENAEIRLHLVPSGEAAIALVEKHEFQGAEIGAVRRKERWTMPPAAVREAVIDAITRTDYAQRDAPIRISIFDDRLEVENPGLLPFGLTVEDLRRGVSKLRNRVVGRVFHDLRLIEQWGSGMQRMTAACREAGLDAPALDEIGTRFRLTLYTTPSGPPETDAVDQSILEALSADNGLSTRQIADAIGRTPRSTRTRLIKLVDRGGSCAKSAPGHKTQSGGITGRGERSNRPDQRLWDSSAQGYSVTG
jgi:predicted HTH transcriptional regulator